MNHKKLAIAVLMVIIGATVFSQDLKIEYQMNLSKADPDNYFSFTGPIRYMAADKDKLDATTGASALGSTHLFQSYLYDVKGLNTMSTGLRGLFLFALSTFDQVSSDNLSAVKASDGTVTINFVHRGTAYQIATDRSGKLSFPDGVFRKRAIGYISGSNPQVIGRDFSSDGSAAKVDYSKVWDSKIAGGKTITAGIANKTGDIASDAANSSSMYYWSGTLDVTLSGGILKISGGLNAIKR